MRGIGRLSTAFCPRYEHFVSSHRYNSGVCGYAEAVSIFA
jgi:hypothetical protein